ncbi:MAG: hypothetical protein QF477_12415 [SAR202 cluster bacterium]|jgi:hypothetical protein|nr:hypothetical protein [SAR202 cluster bacterium]MDP6801268.1 hypothetical protein [SAR202 cluster bacterium]|tara:strand:- start:593 stop:739 length:147 start_codon:yes stop_codon:yes gene_type:complete
MRPEHDEEKQISEAQSTPNPLRFSTLVIVRDGAARVEIKLDWGAMAVP